MSIMGCRLLTCASLWVNRNNRRNAYAYPGLSIYTLYR